jgi:hypothetical protein
MSTSPLGKGQSRGKPDTEDLGKDPKTSDQNSAPKPPSTSATNAPRVWQPSKPAHANTAWLAATAAPQSSNAYADYDEYDRSEPVLVSPRTPRNTVPASSTSSEKVKADAATASTSSTPAPGSSSVATAPTSKPSASTGKTASVPSSSSVSTSPATPGSSGSNRSVAASELTPKLQAIVAAGLQQEGKLSAESLGELLVAIESHCRQAPMSEVGIKDILRPGLRITGYQLSVDAPCDINVIKQFCDPFMKAILDTPEYDRLLKDMIRDFNAVADEVNALCENKKSHQYVRDPAVSALMLPVMTPFLEKFCGNNRSYASSTMPEAMKRLLLAIDAEIILWYRKSGTGVPRDLFNARRNAIANFLSTRSIMPIWDNKLRLMFYDQPGRFNKMTGFLNSYISQMIDDFIKDFMLVQPKQLPEEKSYVEVLAGRKELKSKPSMPRLQLPSHTALNNEKSLKVLSTTPRSLTSSRTATPTSAEKKAADKAEQKAAMQRKLERAKLVDDIAKQASLKKLDDQFYQYLKNTIVDTSARGFDNFKKDPIRSCVKHAKTYYAMPENLKAARTAVPQAIQANLEKIRSNFLPHVSDEDTSEDDAVLDKLMTSVLAQGSGTPLNLPPLPNPFEEDEAQSATPARQVAEIQPVTGSSGSSEGDTQRSGERSSDE